MMPAIQTKNVVLIESLLGVDWQIRFYQTSYVNMLLTSLQQLNETAYQAVLSIRIVRLLSKNVNLDAEMAQIAAKLLLRLISKYEADKTVIVESVSILRCLLHRYPQQIYGTLRYQLNDASNTLFISLAAVIPYILNELDSAESVNFMQVVKNKLSDQDFLSPVTNGILSLVDNGEVQFLQIYTYYDKQIDLFMREMNQISATYEKGRPGLFGLYDEEGQNGASNYGRYLSRKQSSGQGAGSQFAGFYPTGFQPIRNAAGGSRTALNYAYQSSQVSHVEPAARASLPFYPVQLSASLLYLVNFYAESALSGNYESLQILAAAAYFNDSQLACFLGALGHLVKPGMDFYIFDCCLELLSYYLLKIGEISRDVPLPVFCSSDGAQSTCNQASASSIIDINSTMSQPSATNAANPSDPAGKPAGSPGLGPTQLVYVIYIFSYLLKNECSANCQISSQLHIARVFHALLRHYSALHPQFVADCLGYLSKAAGNLDQSKDIVGFYGLREQLALQSFAPCLIYQFLSATPPPMQTKVQRLLFFYILLAAHSVDVFYDVGILMPALEDLIFELKICCPISVFRFVSGRICEKYAEQSILMRNLALSGAYDPQWRCRLATFAWLQAKDLQYYISDVQRSVFPFLEPSRIVGEPPMCSDVTINVLKYLADPVCAVRDYCIVFLKRQFLNAFKVQAAGFFMQFLSRNSAEFVSCQNNEFQPTKRIYTVCNLATAVARSCLILYQGNQEMVCTSLDIKAISKDLLSCAAAVLYCVIDVGGSDEWKRRKSELDALFRELA